MHRENRLPEMVKLRLGTLVGAGPALDHVRGRSRSQGLGLSHPPLRRGSLDMTE